MNISLAARVRALGWFLIAVIYFVLSILVSQHAAQGLASAEWYQLVSRAMLLFLLLIGYAGMGAVGQRQRSPLRAMGLDPRPGWLRELALGAALGWGGIVACVLPIALFGELTLRFDPRAHQWLLLLIDLGVLAVASLAEEVAFRGYPFQRLIDAMGPFFATVFACVLFMVAHRQNPDASNASLVTTLFAGWLMALAYLRTRALWLSWGFHLAWNASMGLLFGLPVSGLTIFSPVVSTYTRGPVWLTGGGYGPEGGAVAILILIGLILILMRSTRELKHRYAGPVIIPGGIPVDVDALAHRQHQLGMGPGAGLGTGTGSSAAASAGQQLVQILIPAPAPPHPPVEERS